MKLPDSNHPIDVKPFRGEVTVRHGDAVVVRTSNALVMTESSYDPVYYIPRSEADMASFERTDRSTYCPYKGTASYFSLLNGDVRQDNAVWTYESPYPAVADIKDHLAFYPDKVAIEATPN